MSDDVTGRRFIILGAGGHGKVVADLVRACGAEVVGFADSDPRKLGRTAEPGGADVLVSQDELFEAFDENGQLPEGSDALVVAVGNNSIREEFVRHFGATLCPHIVHPSAVVSPSAQLGAGTVVFPHAVINADARLGDAVIINTSVVVEHDCQIGDGVHISPQAVLNGGCAVGEETWIGSGASTVHGVSIGARATIGAGTVVIRDLPDGVTAVGNPARIIQQPDES